jgi:hypothetical protein
MTHDAPSFTVRDLKAALSSPHYPPAKKLELAAELARRITAQHIAAPSTKNEKRG